MESHRRRLTRLKNNYTPKMILDIGAYNGEWAMMAKGVFPDSEIFMIEANEDKREILSKLNYPFEIALLGNINRSDVDYYVTNYKHSTGNSIYREQSVYFNDENCSIRKIPMITLDYLIKNSMNYETMNIVNYEAKLLLKLTDIDMNTLSIIDDYLTNIRIDVINFCHSGGNYQCFCCGNKE